MNANFFVTSEAIWQWCSWLTKPRVKIIAKSPHEWQKIGIHGNPYITLFLTHYFGPWLSTQPAKTIIDGSFGHFTKDGVCLALWRHRIIQKIGAKVIFTSE